METAPNFITELLFGLFTATLALAWACSHPLLLCLLLILASLAVGPLLGLAYSKWAIYALILIFLGGIIVVFIYATNLANNEKFFFRPPSSLSPLLVSGALSIPSVAVFIPPSTPLNLGILFFSSSIPVIWLLILYLLFILFIRVKITERFKGALVKTFYTRISSLD